MDAADSHSQTRLGGCVQGYHAARVFTLVYQPFALGTMLILTYHEARINTRLRLISGYTLFFIFILAIPIVSVNTIFEGSL